ncbi:helix-turn-helix domain-containing protein [Endozoicomonas sp. SCSIO W0465]|uniref:helix-turn-helix domain-containing protein n=1 Tax=Endozoicomonas sp. SCSIO W0465 TaxID=2918516 RepID=UPI0020752052|nr:helix-turn-helix domain-containing protein [Endozoicomonas sp. SCSIO W0465]USE39531.1 helix-turn-helix domain containing protein [Endozoicomonas sp. SCSIO W0465]
MQRFTTKLYINADDTEINGHTYRKDTITGFINLTIGIDGVPLLDETTTLYVNTTTELKNDRLNTILGAWSYGFKGRLKSTQLFYKSHYENVVVVSGTVTKDINGGKGKKAIGCWMAAYDKQILVFELHLADGSIRRVTQDDLFDTNSHNQKESDFLEFVVIDNTLDTNISIQMSKAKTDKKVTGRFTDDHRAEILGYMKKGAKDSQLAKLYGKNRSTMKRLRDKFKKEGKL